MEDTKMADFIALNQNIRDIGSTLGNYARDEMARKRQYEDMIQKALFENQLKQRMAEHQFERARQLLPSIFGGQQAMQQPQIQPQFQPQGEPMMSLQGGGMGDVFGRQISQQQEQQISPFIQKPSYSLDPFTGEMKISMSEVENPQYREAQQLKTERRKQETDIANEQRQKASKIEEEQRKPYGDVEAGVISKADILTPKIDELISFVKKNNVYGEGKAFGSLFPFGASRISSFGETGPYQSFKRGLTAGAGRQAGLLLQKIKTLAFGEGGKALTEPEKAIIMPILSPAYKTEDEWVEDLEYVKTLLIEKANLLRKNPSKRLATEQVNQNRQLDKETAIQILQQAGGDKDKARQIATEQGYSF